MLINSIKQKYPIYVNNKTYSCTNSKFSNRIILLSRGCLWKDNGYTIMVQPRGIAHGVMEDWSEALSVTTTPIDTVYLVHPPKIQTINTWTSMQQQCKLPLCYQVLG